MDLPYWLPSELWGEWIEYRRQDKGKPASERSQRMTIKKLGRLRDEGYCPVRLLEMAIEREWQGVYEHEDCRANRANRAARYGSAVERVRAANAGRETVLRVVGEND